MGPPHRALCTVTAMVLAMGLSPFAAMAQGAAPDLTISKTSPTNAFIGGRTAQYVLRVTNAGTAATSAPITVSDGIPALLTPTSASGSGFACTIAGQQVTCTSSAVVAPGASYPNITINVNIGAVTASTPVTNIATVSGGGETNTANNSASLTRTVFEPDPFIDLAITKNHTAPFVVGGSGSYVLGIRNLGLRTTVGPITVSDALPAGLTFVSASGSGWTCGNSGNQVTCTQTTPLAGNTSAGDITIGVTVSAAALPSVTNTATVSTQSDIVPGNNTATVVTPVSAPPDLAIVKSTGSTFTVGGNASYSLAVSNVGLGATTGAITISDNLPAGLSFVSASGTGWTCSAAGSAVTCSRPGPLAAGQALPPVTLTVAVQTAALPSVTNTATVATPNDSDPSNNTSSVTSPVTAPDLAIVKSTGSTFTVGTNATYSLAISNVGTGATTGAITMSDNLPAGLGFVSAAGTGWTCGAAGAAVTCSRPGPLAAGQALPPITLTVAVQSAAIPSVTNTATVATPGDVDLTNNTSSVTSPVAPPLDLAIVKGGSTLVVGSNGTFTLSVQNVSAVPTTGTITVTDALPAGLTFVSASGAGFTCSAAGQNVTCTRAAVLAPGASADITIVVAVGEGAIPSITNTGVVATPGDINTTNNSSTITRTVTRPSLDLALTKEVVGTVNAGGTATFRITVQNVGQSSTTDVISVFDVLQSGLTYVSAGGPGWTCSVAGQSITCTTPQRLALGQSMSLTIVASVSPQTLTVTNTGTVRTAGDNNPDNDSDTVTVGSPVRLDIDLEIIKRATSASFTVGQPGSYTLTVRNIGTLATIEPVVITDTLPVGLTYVSATGMGWTCTFDTPSRTMRCTNPGPIVPTQTTILTVNIVPTAPAVPSVTNTAYVDTPGDVDEDNDKSTDTTPVQQGAQVIDLALEKTGPASMTVGGTSSYTLTVRNLGNAPTVGRITVSDNLPNGLTFVAASGTGWTCTATGITVTCTRDTPMAPGDVSTIDLQVRPTISAVPAVTNCARVSGGGETGPQTNNEGCATTPVVGEPRLEIEKRVSKSEAQIGDVLDYTVLVRNTGTADINDTRVDDDLPVGFTYESRTARADGVRIADPTGAPGPRLSFSIGRVARGGVVTLTYRVRVGVGARVGANTNVAIARDRDGTIQSPQGRATTRIVGGLFDERGAIVGKVFTQCNCATAMQEAGEVGIPGVRVYLEDGSSAVTDVEGKYSFYNVSSRLHVVKVDRQSMPKGSILVPLANRNAGDGWTRFADVKGGEMHKADFAEGSGSSAVMAQVLERRRAGEVENAGRQIRDDASPASAAAAVTGGTGAAAVTPASMSADSTARGTGYRPILGANAALTEQNSQLPATPLRASVLQRGGNPSSTTGRVRLQVPQEGIPADGQSLVQVAVNVVDAAGNPLSGRVAATLEASLGRWLGGDLDGTEQATQVVLQNGGGVFTLVAAAQPGRGEVRVTTDQGTQTLPIHFVPVSRPLMAAGLFNARIDFRSLIRGGNALGSSDDGFEESLRDWSFDNDSGKVRGGARGALLVKGRVFNDQLLTLSYDSERDRGRTYFRDIRPDEFFPVYGDASIREFDAQSRRRFYARLDRGPSFTMFGDFQTDRADDRRMLSAYDRTLTGAMQHFEGSRGKATIFASQGRVRQVVDEVPGRGISGPYVLSRTDGLMNSERVEIIVRDRNQPQVILSRRMLTRFADYTIEPFSARLLMRAPVASADANLNPISIRISYEAESVGADAFWVYGGDASVRLTDALEVGGTFANDENPLEKTQLAGVNATARLGNSTYVMGEFARTEVAGVSGQAERLELRHQSERIEGRLFAARSDSAFTNRSSTFFGGRTELGGRFSALLDDRTRLVGEALRTENTLGVGGKRDGALLSFERQLSNAWRAELGYRYAKQEGILSPNRPDFAPIDRDVSAVRARLNWTLPEQTRSALFAEYEQDVRDDSYRAALGGEYIIANRARLYGRHEWLTGVEGPYGINESTRQEYTVFGVDADYLKNTQMFSEYRARDAFAGRDAEASIGLRNRWAVAPGLLINTSFERVSPLTSGVPGTLGSLGDALAVTGAVEWTRPSLWKSTARLEFRDADAGDNVLASLGYARKLSRDWTLLGRTLWDVYDATTLDQTRGWSQLGLAWRETDRNRWNAVMRYENRVANLGAGVGQPQTETLSHIVAGLLNYQPVQRFTLSGRYAARASRDEVGTLSTNSTAQLLMGRGIFDLNSRFDAGVMASVLASDGFSSRRYGLGGELGLILMTNLRVAGGYNLFGFTDRDLNTFGATRKGAYLELGLKFDESIFGIGTRETPCDNACRTGGKDNE